MPKSAILVLVVSSAFAQSQPQTFNLDVRPQARAVGPNGGGECTLRVRIDQNADVEVRGAIMRVVVLQGGPSFNNGSSCTSALPTNPGNFTFRKVSGRGSAKLVRAPGSNGGTAVINVRDSHGGAGSYEMQLRWDGGWEPIGSGSGNISWQGPGRGDASFPTQAQAQRASVQVRGGQADVSVTLTGAGSVRFTGRASRQSGNDLSVAIDSCFLPSSQRCTGTAQVKRSGASGIESLTIQGTVNGGQFRVNFRR